MAAKPNPAQSQRLAPSVMVGMHDAALTTRSATWNAEDRSFEFVLATETPVRAYRWDDYYERSEIDEQLVMTGIQDLDRLRGQPILDSHSYWSIDSVVGVIESARIEGGTLVCKGRLSARDDVADIAGDIADGIITNMSIGFDILEEVRTTRPGQKDLVQITKWRAREASLVAVPADANANIRSKRENPPKMKTAEEIAAEKLAADNATAAAAAAETARQADIAAGARAMFEEFMASRGAPAPANQGGATPPVAGQPTAAERTAQITALRTAAVRNGMNAEDFDDMVTAGESLDGLRSMLRAAIETRSAETNGTASTRDGAEKTRLVSWNETTVGKRAAGLN